jgi:hypothetical protein
MERNTKPSTPAPKHTQMNRLFFRAALLGTTLLAASSAEAVVFNIDFGTDFGNPLEDYAAAGGAGRWNWIQDADPKELYDGGYNYQTTPVMLTVSADAIQANSGSGHPLSSDYIFSYGNSSWSVEVTGLSAGTYDVYYYAPHNYNSQIETGNFTINGVSVSSLTDWSGGASTISAGTLVQGKSWDVVQVAVENDGKLSLQSNSSQSAAYLGLSGLQIISIPEPATYAALMGGAVLLGAMVWRRRKQ